MSNSNSDFNHVSHAPMATAVSQGDSGLETHALKNRTGNQSDLPEKNVVVEDDEESIRSGPHKPVYDHTHRRLKPRHVQLIGMIEQEFIWSYTAYTEDPTDWRWPHATGIGGTIGTVLYVQIGQTLQEGGPGSLFIAFTIWSVLSPCAYVYFYFIFLSIVSGFVHLPTCLDGSGKVRLGCEYTNTRQKDIPYVLLPSFQWIRDGFLYFLTIGARWYYASLSVRNSQSAILPFYPTNYPYYSVLVLRPISNATSSRWNGDFSTTIIPFYPICRTVRRRGIWCRRWLQLLRVSGGSNPLWDCRMQYDHHILE